MVKKNRADFIASNLPQLQNLVKRDPISYKEEFLQQWRHFESGLAIFALKPDEEAKQFGELITFLSHVSSCYPKECATFPQKIVDLLSNHYQEIHPDLRKTMVQALMLLRNKDLISSTSLLSLFFTLFRCKDKQLRETLHNHIVSDIKNANAKHKNNKLNKTLQNFMYTMLKDSNEVAAKKSLDVMIELYIKHVWDDAKTVNIIAEACLSNMSKLAATAINFFLGKDKEEAPDSDNEDVDMDKLLHQKRINKKTKSRKGQVDKALASIKKKERSKSRNESFNFSALHLLNDPQGFAEKLFSRLKSSTSQSYFRFELRLQFMNLISRLIGIHKLTLLGFYEYLIPYLQPHQREVTQILAYAAQSSHEMVPPDAISPMVEAIANHFIWNNSSNEVVTAGLNGLREICQRCPLAMSETLLQSLVDDYKKHRDKGPSIAIRSLLGLYREINPELLKKKDRGKAATMGMKNFVAPKFGEVRVASDVEGIDLLENAGDGSDNDGAWDEWEIDEDGGESDAEEVAEDEDDDDEGWEDVESEAGGEEDVDPGEGWEDWEVVSNDDEDDEDGEDDENDQDDEDDEENEDEEEDDEQEEATSSKQSARSDSKSQKTDASKKRKVSTEPDELDDKDAKSSKKLGLTAERILTDEDFARLKELRMEREAEKMAGVRPTNRKRFEDEIDEDDSDVDADEKDLVDVRSIMSGIKRKDDYEARMKSIQSGREGREKYGSKKGKKEKGSMTNREKSKKKNYLMMVHKRSVAGKAKRSLSQKQHVLREHIRKQKLRY
ncbi:SDA1-domain-containing protein [Polychytrium aggregatum]|uniref:SDA1-domain-containing protein n=1 Tax=Polychytrium aggregatum TaxID=110093 RepID=UPI0022FE78E6|nr:SDA1-domain-containing protein [Polychytrium aggregatum]KAI9202331.1 SDA1-domain-containing protein [Polychytrium aggregatum]